MLSHTCCSTGTMYSFIQSRTDLTISRIPPNFSLNSSASSLILSTTVPTMASMIGTMLLSNHDHTSRTVSKMRAKASANTSRKVSVSAPSVEKAAAVSPDMAPKLANASSMVCDGVSRSCNHPTKSPTTSPIIPSASNTSPAPATMPSSAGVIFSTMPGIASVIPLIASMMPRLSGSNAPPPSSPSAVSAVRFIVSNAAPMLSLTASPAWRVLSWKSPMLPDAIAIASMAASPASSHLVPNTVTPACIRCTGSSMAMTESVIWPIACSPVMAPDSKAA